MVIDDVHGAHGQARAVHHAANLPVQLDEVQVELAGVDLLLGLFVEVAEGQHIGMAEEGVVIEPDLGIQGGDIAVLGHHQRVDLHHGAVLLHEEPVEVLEEDHALFEAVALEPKGEGHLAGLERAETQGWIHGHLDDLLGGFFGDFFNLHAAFRGGQDGDAAGAAIHQEAQVELAGDVDGFGDEHGADLAALGTGLLGDELHAEDGLEQIGGLVGIRRKLHSPALATATGMDLGLHHAGPAEALGDHSGIFRILRHLPVRGGHLVLPQQFLGLVFVDIHGHSRKGHLPV